MRIVILFFLAALQSAWAITCPSGYLFCAVVTQSHTQIGSTDQTDFPVGIIATCNGSGTGPCASSNADWRTTANGGQIQNTIPAGGLLQGQWQASSATVVGLAGQTVTLSSFNNGISGATATVTLTGVNTIAAGTPIVITNTGSGATALPTTATCGNGTATCSGTANVTTYSNLSVAIPADLVFYDSTCTSIVPFEVDGYTASTGATQTYAKRTLSHTADTLYCAAWDNSAITTFQGDVWATFNGGYVTVVHYSNVIITAGKLTTAFDSTINNNALTNASSDLTQSTGVAGSAQVAPVTATGNSNLGQGSGAMVGYPSGSAVRTEAIFVNRHGTAFNANDVAGGWGSTGTANEWELYGCNGCGIGSGSQLLFWTFGVGQSLAYTVDSNWDQWALTLPSGTTVASILGYVNGTLQTTVSNGGGTTITTTSAGGGAQVKFGTQPGGSLPFQGDIDEVRISNVARSADWLLAEYNNFHAPGSFVTISNTTSGGAGFTPQPFIIVPH